MCGYLKRRECLTVTHLGRVFAWAHDASFTFCHSLSIPIFSHHTIYLPEIPPFFLFFSLLLLLVRLHLHLLLLLFLLFFIYAIFLSVPSERINQRFSNHKKIKAPPKNESSNGSQRTNPAPAPEPEPGSATSAPEPGNATSAPEPGSATSSSSSSSPMEPWTKLHLDTRASPAHLHSWCFQRRHQNLAPLGLLPRSS